MFFLKIKILTLNLLILFGFLIIPVVCHLSFLPGQYVQFQCFEDQEAELFFAGEVEKKVDEADVVTQT